MVQVAILGFGTVGSGVAEVIDHNQDRICRELPGGMQVKYILDLREFPDSPYKDLVVHDINIILEDPEIKVICETMGGKEPAFTFTKQALERGISVCTSNKELVDACGDTLTAVAREHGCSYLFEASVGGGIPILRALRTSCGHEEIESIIGILNGTTNYILTKMEQEERDFEDVLKEAQANGFAERNPSADIDGHDPCRKTAILASLITDKNIKYDQILCEGIREIDRQDIAYARRLGRAVKLLGVCRYDRAREEVSCITAPFLVPEGHPLYSVSNVFNGILIHGNMVGDLMFYGSGAGKLPTASAVAGDMVECALHTGSSIENNLALQPGTVADPAKEIYRYFVRVRAEDAEKAQEIFGDAVEKIEAVGTEDSDFAFVTGAMADGECTEKIAKLQGAKRIRLL